MKESYREGVANHPGPEPCEGGWEAALEALDRGICRLGMELRNPAVRGADGVKQSGRQQRGARQRERDTAPRSGRPRPNPCRTLSRESGPSGLERVREAARKDGKLKFTALLHHVSIDLLRQSYYSLKKQAAPGVDGVRWEEYGEDLEVLADLHGRIHRGGYRAQPSPRVWIPKADGRQRPLGIAALEDKIVQHAVGTAPESELD